MRYILTYTTPAGDTIRCDPREYKAHAASQASRLLREFNPRMDRSTADRYGLQIARKEVGTECVEASTGLRFRIDTEE